MLGDVVVWAKQRFRQAKRMAVEEVPDTLALCEFDCHKTQCRFDEWATCERRLRAERERREYERKPTGPASRD